MVKAILAYTAQNMTELNILDPFRYELSLSR